MSKLNNKGLTLIELLAVIVITSIVMVLITSLFVSGMTKSKEITIDSQLRDDADYIMSNFIKEIYSVQQANIVRTTKNTTGSFLEVSTDMTKCPKKDDGTIDINAACIATLKKIGFLYKPDGVKVVLQDETIQVSYSKILPSSTIEGDPLKTSVYQVTLNLEGTYKRYGKEIPKNISFSNSLQPIIK